MSNLLYPAGTTTEMHDEAFGETSDYGKCANPSCSERILEGDANVVEVGKDLYCNNLCRANTAYDASEILGKTEMKKLVAALELLTQISLYRMPDLKACEASDVTYRQPGLLGMYKTVSLSDLQQDARAILANIGEFGEATPKWSQDALDAVYEFGEGLRKQVTA
jgi:hypothetical protein